ncbi:hypothetical protein BCR35DRAFT_307135 [Leucosporidium creatinivorum]|uniref:Uncharacterized protein n=1 Tax=Leucosporidium creatinivorum TaxID=106004 RepID=A0A1Y2EPE4_9BASI|nr:hypothetical protein BCR35DRAFT_307135 [Leucosporidium creatinivorum]
MIQIGNQSNDQGNLSYQGSSPTKFTDPWALRTYTQHHHQHQQPPPRVPLSPAFTFPSCSNAPSGHLEPAFEFQSSLDAFNLPTTTTSNTSTSSTSTTSTRLRNGSLGSASSSGLDFGDESLGSSPSTSTSSKVSGWPSSSSSALPPSPFTSITPSTPPPLDSMDCDVDSFPSPSPSLSPSSSSPPDQSTHHQLDELSRLHHAAFESLRTSTQEEEEDFLARLRRWEEERQQQQGEGFLGVSPPLGEGVRAPPTSPLGLVRRTSEGGEGLKEDGEEMDEGMVDTIFADCEEEGEEEEEEDINIVLSPSPSPVKSLGLGPVSAEVRGRGSMMMRPKTNLEVEELSRKLKGGVVLEDYGAVREWQERGRGRMGSRDSLGGRI